MNYFKYSILLQLYFLLNVNVCKTKTIREIGHDFQSWIRSIPDVAHQNLAWQSFYKWHLDAQSREKELLDKAKDSEKELLDKAKDREKELLDKAKDREKELLDKAKDREKELLDKAKDREKELLKEIEKKDEKIDKAKGMELSFKPRTLVDDIEDEIVCDYESYLGEIKYKSEQCAKELKSLDGQFQNKENRLKHSPNLSEEEKRNLTIQLDRIDTERNSKRQEQDTYAGLIPPQGGDITKRKRIRYLRWKWALNYKVDDLRISKILFKIKQKYNSKSPDYKSNCTLEKYIDSFCRNIARTHEQASILVAHSVALVSLEDDKYEFKHVHVYGEEGMDEAITIIINAVGISNIPKKKGSRFELQEKPITSS